ncbi:flagella basal body P-ring formation protein FlgA [Brevundimonas sp.]|uniref:flagella basal body P-ring formation protein FlgA n=1 Tax=Brevundimonas sp. TaxID=1871086 RepID=UPI002D3776F9|nr:flagella basal body P-ring formation protein FlgA [Brevundimonas sp.]HYD27883.1 flagella basal body P-ring formation protein FlgA [Brevundimonas sp.]
MRALIAAAAALLIAGPALAGPVTLKANPVDVDGQVTLGDLFDGAGSASGVVIGARSGPSVVFEAGQLQAMARQSGLEWANPTGLRRVVVRHAAVAPIPAAVAAAGDETAAPAPVRAAPVRTAYADRIISRNDIVEVAYAAGGVRLTITGRAEGNAAEGQRLAIRNLQSGRTIDAVATAPGQAVAGPAAQTLRTQQFAARQGNQ